MEVRMISIENVWRSDSWYLLPFRPWHCQCSYEVKQISETNPNRRLGSSTLTEHSGHILAHLWLSTPFQRNRPQHENKPQINTLLSQNLHFELCPIEFVSEFIQMRCRWTEENGNLYLHMQCIYRIDMCVKTHHVIMLESSGLTRVLNRAANHFTLNKWKQKLKICGLAVIRRKYSMMCHTHSCMRFNNNLCEKNKIRERIISGKYEFCRRWTIFYSIHLWSESAFNHCIARGRSHYLAWNYLKVFDGYIWWMTEHELFNFVKSFYLINFLRNNRVKNLWQWFDAFEF